MLVTKAEITAESMIVIEAMVTGSLTGGSRMTERVGVTSSGVVTMTKAVTFAEAETITCVEAVPAPAAVPLQQAGRDTDAGRGTTARSVTAGLGTVVTGSGTAATSVRITDSHSLSPTRAAIGADTRIDITQTIRPEPRAKQGTGTAGVGMTETKHTLSSCVCCKRAPTAIDTAVGTRA